MASSRDLHLHRYPQSKSIDSIRFLHPVSAFDRFIAAAVHDTSTASSAVQIHSLTLNPPNPPNPNKPLLQLRSNWPSPSRISSLRTSITHQKHHAVAALSTLAGSVHFLFVDPVEASIDLELSAEECGILHSGVSGLDLQCGGQECVSVGEDGRVNLVSVGEGRLDVEKVDDNRGVISYTAVRWGSQAEFATGGFGYGLQWWDRRKPGGLVSQLKGNWDQKIPTGIVHSIDIHPSRKHISVVGGSLGTVLAWDLRWQQQPILLSGVGISGTGRSTCESEIWEIQYDIHAQTSSISSTSSTKILPVMACSEDGFLAVIEQGKPHIELLAEECAINSFDIDPENPTDVVCALEWESIGILMRAKEATAVY